MSERTLDGRVEAIWVPSTREMIRVGEKIVAEDGGRTIPAVAWFKQAISEMPDGALIRMSVAVIPPEEPVVWG